MVKILFATGAVALAAAGVYAMVGSGALRNRGNDGSPQVDRADATGDDAEWQVQFVDKYKNPINPGIVKPAPATGYLWNDPASASKSTGKQPSKSSKPGG